MDVAAELLARARAAGAASLAVVGTSKNAGKSVVIAALADGLRREGSHFGLASIGRDGEAVDALHGNLKPRFFLREGAVIATAATLLPRSPALEIIRVMPEQSALGAIVIARVREPCHVEIAGPPSANALRRVVAVLARHVPFVLIDGAVDRIAALRDGDDAIVVAVGASAGPTLEHVIDDVAAFVQRLRLTLADASRPSVRHGGALTAADVAAYVRAGETRQIVVYDATHVTFGGRAFLELARSIDLRCERKLHPVACTIASIAAERSFEPRAFARAVSERTGLPTYDVYANAGAGAA